MSADVEIFLVAGSSAAAVGLLGLLLFFWVARRSVSMAAIVATATTVAAFTAVKAPCSVVCSSRRERYISTLSVKIVKITSFSSSSQYLAALMAASRLQMQLMPMSSSLLMVAGSTPRVAK